MFSNVFLAWKTQCSLSFSCSITAYNPNRLEKDLNRIAYLAEKWKISRAYAILISCIKCLERCHRFPVEACYATECLRKSLYVHFQNKCLRWTLRIHYVLVVPMTTRPALCCMCVCMCVRRAVWNLGKYGEKGLAGIPDIKRTRFWISATAQYPIQRINATYTHTHRDVVSIRGGWLSKTHSEKFTFWLWVSLTEKWRCWWWIRALVDRKFRQLCSFVRPSQFFFCLK